MNKVTKQGCLIFLGLGLIYPVSLLLTPKLLRGSGGYRVRIKNLTPNEYKLTTYIRKDIVVDAKLFSEIEIAPFQDIQFGTFGGFANGPSYMRYVFQLHDSRTGTVREVTLDRSEIECALPRDYLPFRISGSGDLIFEPLPDAVH